MSPYKKNHTYEKFSLKNENILNKIEDNNDHSNYPLVKHFEDKEIFGLFE